jgi:hypothetical protein
VGSAFLTTEITEHTESNKDVNARIAKGGQISVFVAIFRIFEIPVLSLANLKLPQLVRGTFSRARPSAHRRQIPPRPAFSAFPQRQTNNIPAPSPVRFGIIGFLILLLFASILISVYVIYAILWELFTGII